MFPSLNLARTKVHYHWPKGSSKSVTGSWLGGSLALAFLLRARLRTGLGSLNLPVHYRWRRSRPRLQHHQRFVILKGPVMYVGRCRDSEYLQECFENVSLPPKISGLAFCLPVPQVLSRCDGTLERG